MSVQEAGSSCPIALVPSSSTTHHEVELIEVIAGIVLAKGRSTRLPRKNLALLAGRPLLTYILDAAKRSKRLDGVWLSTEDTEVADVAQQFAATVLDRPSSLAEDHVSDVEVLDFVLEQLPSATTIVLLSVTRPLLSCEDIDACLDLHDANPHSGIVALTDVPSGAWHLSATIDEQRHVTWNHFLVGLRDTTSQSLESKQRVYRPAGIWVVSREAFLRHGSVYVEKSLAHLVPKERSLDINDEFDLACAEGLIARFGH